MRSVFEFKDYKKYLLEIEKIEKFHSFRTLLARSAPCQNAYVSQVLGGDKHFSLEQMDGISDLLSLTGDERNYIYLLLQHARAGKTSLRGFFADQLGAMAQKHLTLHNRVHTGETLNEKDQLTYYSEWFYSALHVLVTIHSHRSVEAMVQRLNLPTTTIKRALEFLVGCGLLQEAKGIYTTGQARLYLRGDSPLISRHHANWRIHSLQSLFGARSEDLHYSSVVTLSKDDTAVIREQLIQAIQKAKKVIRESPEEDLYAFHVDFYRV
jgi:uncharacterized protein (TIGR02147 family)